MTTLKRAVRDAKRNELRIVDSALAQTILASRSRISSVRKFVATVRPEGSYPGKRTLDLIFAAFALLLFAPLMCVIWLAVVATSPGPGLYWSPRVGRFGRTFLMPKFRTMTVGAPMVARELLGAEEVITPLGLFLRRASLDELPQLFCILQGSMSVIGPRPLLECDPAVRARLQFPDGMSARPGLSGIAQVRGRNFVSPRRKARLDAFYSRNASLLFDFELLVRTVVIVATGFGLR